MRGICKITRALYNVQVRIRIRRGINKILFRKIGMMHLYLAEKRVHHDKIKKKGHKATTHKTVAYILWSRLCEISVTATETVAFAVSTTPTSLDGAQCRLLLSVLSTPAAASNVSGAARSSLKVACRQCWVWRKGEAGGAEAICVVQKTSRDAVVVVVVVLDIKPLLSLLFSAQSAERVQTPSTAKDSLPALNDELPPSLNSSPPDSINPWGF